MNKEIMIGNHKISEDSPTFVIAEMSANHLMDFDRAVAIMQAAKDAGADAIKIQTYTPDTITLDCDDPCFQITQGTIWDGTTLHKLYETAYTPWEWQPKLKKIAEEMGLVFFSSPFDLTSIDFLEEMEVPVYKVASSRLTTFLSSARSPVPASRLSCLPELPIWRISSWHCVPVRKRATRM